MTAHAPKFEKRAREHALLLLAQGAILFVFATNWRQLDGFPLDDAWIHQVVARTFATTGTLGYLPHAFGSGATSYLWAALLAPNFAVLHWDPVVYTLALNGTLYLCCTHGLLVLLRNDHVDLWTRLALAACASIGGNFVWFAFSGMEAMLFSTLSLGAILALTIPARRPAVSAAVSGGFLLALVLTRPEGAALATLLGAFLVARRRPLLEAAALLAPWALGLVVYYGANSLLAGSAVPPTLEGRRWMWLDASAGHSHPVVALFYLSDWLERLRDYSLGARTCIVLWTATAFFFIGVVEAIRLRYHGVLLFAAWAALHLAIYAVILPMLGHGGRYQPLTPLLFVLFVALGAITLARSVARSLGPYTGDLQPALVTAAGVAPLVFLLIRGVLAWREGHADAIEHIRDTEQALASEFARLPESATVASFDIGASGFFSVREVLDLGALTRPSSVEYLKSGHIADYMRARHVTHVAIPLGYNDAFPDLFNFGYRLHLFENPAVQLHLLRVLESPPSIWVPGIRSTMHSAPRQGLFEVSYPERQPEPRPSSSTPSELRDPEHLLSRESTRQVTYSLAAMAFAGLSVELSVSTIDPGPRHGSTARGFLRMFAGPWGARVEPEAELSSDELTTEETLMTDWVRGYLELGDLTGALRAGLHAVTLAYRHRNPSFQPMLPPLSYPTKPGPAPYSPEESILVGLPAALLFALISLWYSHTTPRRGPAP